MNERQRKAEEIIFGDLFQDRAILRSNIDSRGEKKKQHLNLLVYTLPVFLNR